MIAFALAAAMALSYPTWRTLVRPDPLAATFAKALVLVLLWGALVLAPLRSAGVIQ